MRVANLRANLSETGEGSGFPIANWSTVFRKASDELKLLAGSTEDEFLSIGARLHDFHQRAGSVKQLAGTVVDQISGDAIHGAIDGLTLILDKMGEYLNDAETDAEVDCRSLEDVLHLLVKVSEPLAGFRKINKVLRMLGISTKIESARLGQSAAGFDTLAADVANLSVQVLEKSETILAQQGELSLTIRETLSRVEAIEADQRAQVRSILEKTRESLTSLREINGRCSSLAEVIAKASTDVSRSISEVVTSMQFHDIVRQQIEHVKDALSELHDRTDAASAGAGGATDERDLVVEVGDIGELQVAQLRQASQEIRSAIISIVENLCGIAVKEAETAEETRVMAGMADQAGSSFFADMELDLERVASSLAESAKANQSISQAMTAVAGTVGEIVAFVSDIEHIGEEIELIALNAQIKAARTGDEGAALGVLAEAIQRLSVEAQAQTATVSETLRSITETTEKLFRGVDAETAALEKDVDTLVGRLHDLLRTLRHLNESVVTSLSQLEHEVRGLSSDIETATASITVHERMSAGLDEVIDSLEKLVAQTRVLVPLDSVSGRAERLKELASRYTMHSERKVHATVAQEVGPLGGVVSGSGAEAEDLGDNIEMF